MTCGYCQFFIAEGEHRCEHCGRRAASGSGSTPRSAGATALAAVAGIAPAAGPAKVCAPQPEIVSRGSSQASLFPPGSYPAGSSATGYAPLEVIPRASRPPAIAATHLLDKTHRKSAAARTGDPAQSTIDFLPTAALGPRKLKTTVEAVVYCSEPVAAPRHRSLAAALDGSMIFIAFGLFMVVFHLLAGTITWNVTAIAVFAAAFALITLFYGVLWAMYGRETPGMHWTHLRLVNFDGHPPDGKSRALRVAGSWLSFCSGTIGLWWAIMDEENLTWHDHMSKTFPTLRESNSTFFQQR